MTSGVKKTPPTILAQVLRDVREGAGLTQAQLAAVFGTPGIANRICDYEIGTREPQLKILRKYAACAGVTVSQLLDGVA